MQVVLPGLRVELGPLRAAAAEGCATATQWVEILTEDVGDPSLLCIAQVLGRKSGGIASQLFEQFVVQLGRHIDSTLRDDNFMACGAAHSCLVEASAKSSELHMQEHLSAYVAGGRKHIARYFQDTPMVSVTLDDSNARSMEICNSAIITGDNVGYWAPPQVASGGAGRGKTSSVETQASAIRVVFRVASSVIPWAFEVSTASYMMLNCSCMAQTSQQDNRYTAMALRFGDDVWREPEFPLYDKC